MRFLNMLGNRIFARLLKGIIGQHVKDTLCGTKVLPEAGLRADRRRPLVLRRVRPVRRLRPALRRGAARPEDRRPARALPRAHVRRDEHQPLAPRRAAPPDDGLRVLEVQGRTAHAPRRLSGPLRRCGRSVGRSLALGAVVTSRRSSSRRSRPLAVVDVRRRGRDATPRPRSTSARRRR